MVTHMPDAAIWLIPVAKLISIIIWLIPVGQADQHQDQHQHPLWLEAVVTPRRPEPLVGSGLVTALQHGLSLGYRGDVAL